MKVFLELVQKEKFFQKELTPDLLCSTLDRQNLGSTGLNWAQSGSFEKMTNKNKTLFFKHIALQVLDHADF